jgi:hypothetical protein
MATTQDREKVSRRRSRLTTGYDSLTLDPSPRLRRLRREVFPPSETGIENAWKSVGSAMSQAMRTVARALRDERES